MSDQWTVSEMRNILRPQIEEAYREIAPEHPTRSCYVAVPIPAPAFDSEALAEEFGRALSADWPAVQRVTYMPPGDPITLDDGSEYTPSPGLVVHFRPWAETEEPA